MGSWENRTEINTLDISMQYAKPVPFTFVGKISISLSEEVGSSTHILFTANLVCLDTNTSVNIKQMAANFGQQAA